MLTTLPGYPPCSLPGPAHLQQTPRVGPKGASPAHESTASLTKLEKSWSLIRRFTFWNWSKSPLPFSVHRSHMLPAASAFIQADSCTRETQSDEPSLLPRRGSQGSPDLSAGLRQEPWPEALQGQCMVSPTGWAPRLTHPDMLQVEGKVPDEGLDQTLLHPEIFLCLFKGFILQL